MPPAIGVVENLDGPAIHDNPARLLVYAPIHPGRSRHLISRLR